MSKRQSRVPEKKFLQKSVQQTSMELRTCGGPGYNGDPAMQLNNDVNKWPAMHWQGTYWGLCCFLLWRVPGRVSKVFQNGHTYKKWLEATRGRERKTEGLVFYLLLGGWCLCLPCDPHSLPVISRAQEVCDLWFTVKWAEINKSGAGALTGIYCCKERRWVWTVALHPFSGTMGKFAMIPGKESCSSFQCFRVNRKKWSAVF